MLIRSDANDIDLFTLG